MGRKINKFYSNKCAQEYLNNLKKNKFQEDWKKLKMRV